CMRRIMSPAVAKNGGDAWRGAMTKLAMRVMVAGLAVLVSGVAFAEVTLNSVRVAATDTEALAKFYKAAFGMQEVNRLPVRAGPEISVNFAATVAAAKPTRTPPVVIMHRDSDAMKDPIAHV